MIINFSKDKPFTYSRDEDGNLVIVCRGRSNYIDKYEELGLLYILEVHEEREADIYTLTCYEPSEYEDRNLYPDDNEEDEMPF